MLYAAYGSNLHPERLQARTPSARLLGTSSLTGWRLTFNKRGQDGSGKCNITPQDCSVQVAVFEISSLDVQTLDRIEGLNKGYQARAFVVPGFGECFAYVASDTHIDHHVNPFSWYKGLVLAGCEFHGFEAEYAAAIEIVTHCMDADRSRHEEYSRLCQRLKAAARRDDGNQAVPAR